MQINAESKRSCKNEFRIRAGEPCIHFEPETVALRVIVVWLYNNTAKSVFAAALFHTTINVTWQLFPIQGSFFDPRITGAIAAFVAAAVIVVWGPRTLARRAEGAA
jgi:hypothetical protein